MAEEVDLKQKDLLKFGMMMWKFKPFVGKSGRGAVERWKVGSGSHIHELLVQPKTNLNLCLHLSPGS